MVALDSLTENEQKKLFEVIAEHLECADRDEFISRDELLREYPHLKHALQEFFDASDWVAHIVEPAVANMTALRWFTGVLG